MRTTLVEMLKSELIFVFSVIVEMPKGEKVYVFSIVIEMPKTTCFI
jgi:hypothetical protein